MAGTALMAQMFGQPIFVGVLPFFLIFNHTGLLLLEGDAGGVLCLTVK